MFKKALKFSYIILLFLMIIFIGWFTFQSFLFFIDLWKVDQTLKIFCMAFANLGVLALIGKTIQREFK